MNWLAGSFASRLLWLGSGRWHKVVRHFTRAYYDEDANGIASSEEDGRQEMTWREKRERSKCGHDLWRPKKRLTRHEMEHLRHLNSLSREEWNFDRLAVKFGISKMAVGKILKSKFQPTPEIQKRQDKNVKELREERRRQSEEKVKLNQKSRRNKRDGVMPEHKVDTWKDRFHQTRAEIEYRGHEHVRCVPQGSVTSQIRRPFSIKKKYS